MRLTVLVASLLAILVALFAVQNSATTTVAFLTWRFESSLAVVLVTTFALGVACMALIGTPANLRQHWERRQRRIEIEALQSEIRDLRSRLELEKTAVPSGRLIDVDGSPSRIEPRDLP
jgi:uncharacterized integral membrane protein